jgi:hypothetical protein
MVLFFMVTLAVSIAGMVTLLMLKRYELNSGRILLGSARPHIGEFFHRKLVWLEYVLPGLIRVSARVLYRAARRLVHVFAAWVVVKVEQGLEYALHTVRHTTTAPRRSGETSVFLRQVAEHKKKLQDDNPGNKGTVLEE